MLFNSRKLPTVANSLELLLFLIIIAVVYVTHILYSFIKIHSPMKVFSGLPA